MPFPCCCFFSFPPLPLFIPSSISLQDHHHHHPLLLVPATLFSPHHHFQFSLPPFTPVFSFPFLPLSPTSISPADSKHSKKVLEMHNLKKTTKLDNKQPTRLQLRPIIVESNSRQPWKRWRRTATHLLCLCRFPFCCVYSRKAAGGADLGICWRLTPSGRVDGKPMRKMVRFKLHPLSLPLAYFDVALCERYRGLRDQPPHAHDSARFPTFCSLGVGSNGNSTGSGNASRKSIISERIT